jgi:hypothetical protein
MIETRLGLRLGLGAAPSVWLCAASDRFAARAPRAATPPPRQKYYLIINELAPSHVIR